MKNRLLRVPVFATAALALGTSFAATAQDLGDVGVGQDLAERVCSTCHRVEKGETDEKFLDVAAFQTLADSPSKTALNLRVFLKSPHRNMPDLILTEVEIDSVIAYIFSLKSPAKDR